MSKKFYHYTIADRLVKILISGHIKVMEESSKQSEDEPCLAWLTTSNEWDRTAFYGYPDEVLDNAGRIRITLNGEYTSYRKYRHNIPNVEILEISGLQVGCNLDDWHVSPEVIPMSHFEKVELWRDNRWEEVPCLKN